MIYILTHGDGFEPTTYGVFEGPDGLDLDSATVRQEYLAVEEVRERRRDWCGRSDDYQRWLIDYFGLKPVAAQEWFTDTCSLEQQKTSWFGQRAPG